MGQVRKPMVPDGPIRDFYDRLHELHGAAGYPSMRDLQRRTRSLQRPNGINPTTIHDALSAPRLASWETVRILVDQLAGDVDEFAALWQRGRTAEAQATPEGTPTFAPPGRAEPGGEAAGSAPPRELPPDVQPFVGRGAELAKLDRLLTQRTDPGQAASICAVVGTAGVGKTALAVHWAHRAAAHFPDGHLYLDLRGYDPGGPVPPGQALAASLRALGVPDTDIPRGVDECAARYRSLLATRRTLIVLDNVYCAEHVRPLLPGASSCFVVLTSRNRLAGLVARHGVNRIDLARFSSAEASELLRALLKNEGGHDRAHLEALAERCARLPLALRIAAELAEVGHGTGLPELLQELDGAANRLDLFDAGGDPRTALREVFSWSYRGLPDDAARAFRMVSLHEGPDFDLDAMAAMMGVRRVEAQRLADVLVHAHLLERTRRGRFGLHGLLSAYAAELCGHHDTDTLRRAALSRLADQLRPTRAPLGATSRHERLQPVGAH